MHHLDGFTLILFLVGVLLNFSGYLWILAEAFRKRVLWGMAVLFLPFAVFIFALTNLRRTAKPFVLLSTATAIFAGLFCTNENFREAVSAHSSSKIIAQMNRPELPPAPVAARITTPEVKVAVSKHALHRSSAHHHHGH